MFTGVTIYMYLSPESFNLKKGVNITSLIDNHYHLTSLLEGLSLLIYGYFLFKIELFLRSVKDSFVHHSLTK